MLSGIFDLFYGVLQYVAGVEWFIALMAAGAYYGTVCLILFLFDR